MKHIVYLLEIKSDNIQTKYIGQKSNAQIIDGQVISDGSIYLTSTSCQTLADMLISGTEHTFSLLGEFDDYQQALQYERELHILHDVVAQPVYFNKAIATINNFSDPAFATYKHAAAGKTVRLKRDHPMVISGEYVGVQKGASLDEQRRKKMQRPGELNPFYGKTHTQETRNIISERASIKVREYYANLTPQEYDELCLKRSIAATGVKKNPKWVEAIKGQVNMRNPVDGTNKRILAHERDYYQKLGWVHSNAGVKHKTVQCPHCGKVGSGPNMKRWHYDNCKSKDVLN